MSTRTAFICGACLLLPIACAPGGADPDAGTGQDATSAADAGADDSAAGSDSAIDTPDASISFDAARDPACDRDVWLAQVSGRIVDEAGAGVGEAMAQLCVRRNSTSAQLVCVQPVATAADGSYVVVVPESARCITRATMRALLPLQPYAASYCDIELSGAEGVLNVDEPVRLAQTTPVVSLPALGDSAQARAVLFDDGLEIDVVPDRFYAEYELLGGRRVDPAQVPLCFVGAGEFEGVYAFSPEGDVGGGGFDMRIPNSTGIPAGASVELFVLGGIGCHLADGSTVPEGEWVRYGDGTVSGDGSQIEASGANALPCLNWLGYNRVN